METTYYKLKESNGKTTWNIREVTVNEDGSTTIREVSLMKKPTSKQPFWGIQLGANHEGLEETDENDWLSAVQEFRDYVASCLD